MRPCSPALSPQPSSPGRQTKSEQGQGPRDTDPPDKGTLVGSVS